MRKEDYKLEKKLNANYMIILLLLFVCFYTRHESIIMCRRVAGRVCVCVYVFFSFF